MLDDRCVGESAVGSAEVVFDRASGRHRFADYGDRRLRVQVYGDLRSEVVERIVVIPLLPNSRTKESEAKTGCP
jgi:hypothetical protein